MDFEQSAKAKEYSEKMWDFMLSHVFLPRRRTPPR